MNRKFLLSSAAIALVLGLTPALAQQDRTDSKMKGDPAATEQQHHDKNKQSAEHESRTKRNAENKDRSGSRSTTGQASGETGDKAKSADTETNKSGADRAKGAENEKNASQPKQAEDLSKKPSNSAATSKPNSAEPAKNAETDKAKTAEPSKNAEQNNTRSPAAQKSTQTNEPNRNAQTNDPSRNTADSKNAAAPNTRISASLDPQKKTRLTTAFDKIDVKPVTHVNFSVSVGTAVPRDIELRPVPRTIVEIVPQYRDYDFFVVRDEIVIVQPRTHKIVDVIERGPSHARAETTTEHRPRLSSHQREIIRRHASSHRKATTGSGSRTTTEITVGETLPESVEIESFPEDVYREVPAVREYRYIERGDDMYLVDPSSRRVIEEVR
ncbi:MAG TPA: DUF1236 domain-containing protein [Pseudolabrys sp.]|nr:DUF1236 domain-containing protein [Pseudolabrys sp.]